MKVLGVKQIKVGPRNVAERRREQEIEANQLRSKASVLEWGRGVPQLLYPSRQGQLAALSRLLQASAKRIEVISRETSPERTGKRDTTVTNTKFVRKRPGM